MRIRTLRRTTQIGTFILMVLIPVLNKKGITALMGSLYSLAVGPVWITDPMSGFQVVISAFAADRILLLSMGIPIVFAFIFGRVFCGWMCPQNTVSEFFDALAAKVMSKRPVRHYPSPRIRYGTMLLMLLAAFLFGFPVANLISAPGIISVQVSNYVYFGSVGMELGLIGAIIFSEVFLVRRVWCNYICPQGTFLALFRMGKTMKVVYGEDEQHACGKCFECADACRLGLDPMGSVLYPACHNCGDCIDACEKMRAGGKPLAFRF